MRVCFLDFAKWDYRVDGPTLMPLGGSHSALCYLAVALSRIGHQITVMSGTTQPGIVQGVECLNTEDGNPWFFRNRAFDAVIVQNSAIFSKLRDILPSSTRLILWTQHEPVQPAMQRLRDPKISSRWDGIVCVSEWQRNAYVKDFGLALDRMAVIRNAIAPCFERLFRDEQDLANAKSNPLTLAYTSTPYRGLKHLIDVFPPLKRERPEATLNVYSSMAVYQKHEAYDIDTFAPMYAALRSIDGIEYVGSLPQPVLAERLATSHILAYPNIFPETSCIAVMEAMAAGMRVVTSDFAALPETTEGYADLVPLDHRDVDGFVREYTRALSLSRATPGELYDQVMHMNRNHTWAVRAKQWEAYLS